MIEEDKKDLIEEVYETIDECASLCEVLHEAMYYGPSSYEHPIKVCALLNLILGDSANRLKSILEDE